jgi:predicted nucleic acid-binding protein
MIYLDTSVVVALLTPEERSAQALDWFAESREPLISSDWLITETHTAAVWASSCRELPPFRRGTTAARTSCT